MLTYSLCSFMFLMKALSGNMRISLLFNDLSKSNTNSQFNTQYLCMLKKINDKENLFIAYTDTVFCLLKCILQTKSLSTLQIVKPCHVCMSLLVY